MSFIDKLKSYAKSAEGRKTIEQVSSKAQALAKDPKNRAKLEEVANRLRGATKGGGGKAAPLVADPVEPTSPSVTPPPPGEPTPPPT